MLEKLQTRSILRNFYCQKDEIEGTELIWEGTIKRNWFPLLNMVSNNKIKKELNSYNHIYRIKENPDSGHIIFPKGEILWDLYYEGGYDDDDDEATIAFQLKYLFYE